MEDELIKRAKQGDDRAFRKLVEQHLHIVEKFAYQLGVDHALVEDVTQEVFIKVYRFLHSYSHGKFTTWLYSITINTVRDMYRQEQSHLRKIEKLKKEDRAESETFTNFDENVSYLHECIQKLDDKYKIPIILHYFHNESFKEIALVLGVSEGAIKTRMMRARQQLKEKFEKVGEER